MWFRPLIVFFIQQAVVLGDGSRVLHYFRPVVEKGGDVPVGHVVEKPLVPMHEAQVIYNECA